VPRCYAGSARHVLTIVSLNLTITPAQAGKALNVTNVGRASATPGGGYNW